MAAKRSSRGSHIAVSGERDAARRALALVLKQHVEAVVREDAAGALRPFDEREALAQREVEPELVELGGRVEAIEIEMRHRHARRRRRSAPA